MDPFIVNSMIGFAAILAVVTTPTYITTALLCFIQHQIHRTPSLSRYQLNVACLWWLVCTATSGIMISWANQLDSNYLHCFGWGLIGGLFTVFSCFQYRVTKPTQFDVTRRRQHESFRSSQADDDDSWIPLQNE